MSEYIDFFKDIDAFLEKDFKKERIKFKIVGYAALALAGLRLTRGTKDVDTLKTEALKMPENEPLLKHLESEFGKKSPGLYRHGMYLDVVSENIVWLPPHPKFIGLIELKCLNVLRLDPTDVCASKVFGYCKSRVVRANDKSDIITALDEGLIDFKELVDRLDETLPLYETDARAPDAFLKLFELMKELANHCDSKHSLIYEIPEWMHNV